MLPREFELQFADLFGGGTISVTLHEGITTFLGPNGSGKSQTLRALKRRLGDKLDEESLLLSAGRLRPLEANRVIEQAHRNRPDQAGNPNLTLRDDFRDQWANVETVKGVFNRISERVDVQIKVAERLRTLFGREIILDWERGELQVRFSRGGEEYSGDRESSGLLHLVGILSALYDDSLDAVLIDEPDISLHPQLQSFLLREMKRVAGDPDEGGKMVVIATHAPAMAPIKGADDLPRFVFFNDADTPPEQVDANEGVLNNKSLSGLVQNLGASHRKALFAQRPLLVEGPSDETVVEALDGALGTHLNAAGGYVLPVGGTAEIPAAVKLLRLAGKQPAVLADLDAFADDLDLVNQFNGVESGKIAANEASHGSLYDAAKDAHDELSNAVQDHWDAVASMAKKHPYWKEDNSNSDTDQFDRKRRAVAATLLRRNEEAVEKWPDGTEVWLPLRKRLCAALEILERAGCFILREGEIEDHYTDLDSRKGKIDEAEQEAEEVRENPGRARSRYPVVVRAIEHVAKSPEVDESSAVREAFAAVVAPALSRLRKDPTVQTEDLEAAASQHATEAAQLFELERTDKQGSPAIQIKLRASVLDVSGFPITLGVGESIKVAEGRIKSSGPKSTVE